MKLKKLAAIFLSAVMAVSVTTSAFAEEPQPTGSITMQNSAGGTKTNSSYSAYQVVKFNASLLDGKTVYTDMKLNPDYKNAIIDSIGSSLSSSSSDEDVLSEMEKLKDDATETAALAVALKGVTPSDEDFVYSTATNGVFNNLPYGYYLVIETANNANDGTVISKPILVGVPEKDVEAITDDVNVIVKTSKATIEKKIVETDPDNSAKTILVDSNTAAFGDTIRYQSTSTFPTYSSDSTGITYYVTDTFSNGLQFNQNGGIDSVEVVDNDDNQIKSLTDSNTDNTYYQLTYTTLPDSSETTFKLELQGDSKDDNIKAWGNEGYKLVIKYHATLTGDVNFGNIGNPNSIRLTYSNKPGSADDTYTTPDDTVITYTNKLVITKTDSTNSSKKLSGATFKLYRSTGEDGQNPTWGETPVDTQTTVTDGTATFTKLQQGTYKLVETQAPAGYNLLTEPIEFTVVAKNENTGIPDTSINLTQSGNESALAFQATWTTAGEQRPEVSDDDGSLTLDIANTTGTQLPGTGGMGTTPFVVGGLLILCAAGAFLFFNRKRVFGK